MKSVPLFVTGGGTHEWNGHGRKPKWLQEELARGEKLADYVNPHHPDAMKRLALIEKQEMKASQPKMKRPMRKTKTKVEEPKTVGLDPEDHFVDHFVKDQLVYMKSGNGTLLRVVSGPGPHPAIPSVEAYWIQPTTKSSPPFLAPTSDLMDAKSMPVELVAEVTASLKKLLNAQAKFAEQKSHRPRSKIKSAVITDKTMHDLYQQFKLTILANYKPI